MGIKSERFELRLDEEIIENVDKWRSNQRELPSRAEAIRRLVEKGLSLELSQNNVQITDGEKLIISMLAELNKHGKVEGDIDPDFVTSAISGGHYWALNWELPGLYATRADNPQDVTFVVDVLVMWDALERSHDKLSAKDKARVKEHALFVGRQFRFPGFDGNEECSYMSIAYFLVNKMGRFEDLKGKDLNSHAPMIEGYKRMFSAYSPIKNNLMGGYLSCDQIIAILKVFPRPR